jgi:predicted NAD/FAD-binding protein
LFELLKVPTNTSDMSFAASLNDGALEYSGTGVAGVFGQPRNLLRPRFWSMAIDLLRFYHRATRDADRVEDEQLSLGEYLAEGRYGEAFRNDHLLPMASAIWSATPAEMLSYPAAAFIRFHRNHGLLQLRERPAWETVVGGSVFPTCGTANPTLTIAALALRAADHVLSILPQFPARAMV